VENGRAGFWYLRLRKHRETTWLVRKDRNECKIVTVITSASQTFTEIFQQSREDLFLEHLYWIYLVLGRAALWRVFLTGVKYFGALMRRKPILQRTMQAGDCAVSGTPSKVRHMLVCLRSRVGPSGLRMRGQAAKFRAPGVRRRCGATPSSGASRALRAASALAQSRASSMHILTSNGGGVEDLLPALNWTPLPIQGSHLSIAQYQLKLFYL
jgi:hypothetical protein